MTALSYLDASRQWDLMAMAYNFMAITSMNRGNAPFAMDYYLSAMSYCSRYHLEDVGAMVNINIGALYHNFRDDFQAQHYFDVSRSIVESNLDMENKSSLMMSICIGMANTYLCRDVMTKAREWMEQAEREYEVNQDKMDHLCLYCFQARFYHAEGKLRLRDETIKRVTELAGPEIPILDIFEDLYEYCEMLLTASKYEELWDMLVILENLAKFANIINLQKRILSIKIRYYKIKEDHAGFLQASGLYYELSEMLEKENSYMIGKMLNIRNFLEESTKQQKQMEEENRELHVRSETDALTGLPNRYSLNKMAEKTFGEAIRKRSSYTIEILDIDFFKQFNDNYGHQEGDSCIYKVARAIESMGEHDNIFSARYGGDEFVLIYRGYSKEAVKNLMQELRLKIEDLNVEHKFSSAANVVTISQGACWGVPGEDDKVWDFLHTADAMLYRTKNKARNNASVCEYGEV